MGPRLGRRGRRRRERRRHAHPPPFHGGHDFDVVEDDLAAGGRWRASGQILYRGHDFDVVEDGAFGTLQIDVGIGEPFNGATTLTTLTSWKTTISRGSSADLLVLQCSRTTSTSWKTCASIFLRLDPPLRLGHDLIVKDLPDFVPTPMTCLNGATILTSRKTAIIHGIIPVAVERRNALQWGHRLRRRGRRPEVDCRRPDRATDALQWGHDIDVV